MARVLIGVPLHGGVTDAYRKAKEGFIRAYAPKDGCEVDWREMRGSGGITVARNMLAGKAIREKFGILLFLAGDIGYPGDNLAGVFERVMAHFERPEVNVVAGVYLFKEFPLRLCLSQDQDRTPDEHGLIEVREVGTDFMAIRVAAMEEVIGRWPGISAAVHGTMIPLDYETPAGREWNIFGQAVVFEEGTDSQRFLPEDFYWCRLVREAGMKVHVDTRVRLQHWGACNYDASVASGIDAAIGTRMPSWQHGATHAR